MFTGREYIQQFGIYEYRARAYYPGLGRFLSEDPKGFDAGDYNLFRYCKNDPEDLTDPTGLDPVPPATSPIGAAEKDATQAFHDAVQKCEKNLRPDADGVPAKDIGKKGYDDERQAVKDMKENAHAIRREGTIQVRTEERVYTESSDGKSLHRAGPSVGGRNENDQPQASLPKSPNGTGFPITASHGHPLGAGHGPDRDDVNIANGRFPNPTGKAIIIFVGHVSDDGRRGSVIVPTGEGQGAFFHTYDGAIFHPGP
jgi:RHS repeat-associated protein